MTVTNLEISTYLFQRNGSTTVSSRQHCQCRQCCRHCCCCFSSGSRFASRSSSARNLDSRRPESHPRPPFFRKTSRLVELSQKLLQFSNGEKKSDSSLLKARIDFFQLWLIMFQSYQLVSAPKWVTSFSCAR